MRFRLNLVDIINEMRNQYGETLENIGGVNLVWKIIDEIESGNINLNLEKISDYLYLCIDIPDENKVIGR